MAPVTIITAKAAAAIRERAEQAGCAAFLTKPFLTTPFRGETILALLDSFGGHSHP